MAMFLTGLLLKIALTAGIVVTASIVVERSGPFIGALIAALPTAGGAAMIILAWEHPPAFIAESAVGSMVANAVVAVFALSYAALAQRNTLLVSISGAYVVWFGAAFLTRYVEWNAASAAPAAAFALPVWFGAYTPPPRISRGAPGVVTLCVLIVTAASYSIGSFLSGLFAFFPVATGSFFVILQPRIGGPAAASVAAHVHAPLIGLGLSLLAVHLLAEPIGVWWSYAAGLSIGISWNALLWGLRIWRQCATQNEGVSS
jgi:hypothetical protein